MFLPRRALAKMSWVGSLAEEDRCDTLAGTGEATTTTVSSERGADGQREDGGPDGYRGVPGAVPEPAVELLHHRL